MIAEKPWVNKVIAEEPQDVTPPDFTKFNEETPQYAIRVNEDKSQYTIRVNEEKPKDVIRVSAEKPKDVMRFNAEKPKDVITRVNVTRNEVLKNPGVAAVLSTVWPGTGQIYNGQISKGLAIFVLQLALLLFSVPLVLLVFPLAAISLVFLGPLPLFFISFLSLICMVSLPLVP